MRHCHIFNDAVCLGTPPTPHPAPPSSGAQITSVWFISTRDGGAPSSAAWTWSRCGSDFSIFRSRIGSLQSAAFGSERLRSGVALRDVDLRHTNWAATGFCRFKNKFLSLYFNGFFKKKKYFALTGVPAGVNDLGDRRINKFPQFIFHRRTQFGCKWRHVGSSSRRSCALTLPSRVSVRPALA